MELIIKVTDRCNFACTFCSSSNISKGSMFRDLDIELVKKFLIRYPETQTIIINGGDPLMVSPDYYWKLIEFLEKKKLRATISITTNLWDFYIYPEKWKDLFNHPRVGVSTSFNYGNTRRISKDKVFTEKIFLEVIKKFYKEFGYRPDFISVINAENKDTAIKNVLLAKKLGVECKLNGAMASGRSSKPFPLGEMYKIYAEIHDLGLDDFEYNTKQIFKKEGGEHTTCPLTKSCSSYIRCLQPNGYAACGAFGDDGEYLINFQDEINGDFINPYEEDRLKLRYLKDECLFCEYFNYCNSCRKIVKDLKKHNLVEESCKGMKEAWKKLKN